MVNQENEYKNIDELIVAIDDYIYYSYDRIKRIVTYKLQVTIL